MAGVKYDRGKAIHAAIPPCASRAMSEAFTEGARKYGLYNYRNGMEWSRIYSATMRHLLDFWERVDRDPESGILALGHAMADVAMLIDCQVHGIGVDDRPDRHPQLVPIVSKKEDDNV